MRAQTGKAYAVAVTLAVIVFAMVAGLAGWFGLLSPRVGFSGGGGWTIDELSRKGEAELSIRNRGIVSIDIDGPATVDIPGVVVDLASTHGSIHGVSVANYLDQILEPGNPNHGVLTDLDLQITVTSCDAVSRHIDTLRRGGRRSVSLDAKLTVPVRTWNGKTDIALDDAFTSGSEPVGRIVAHICGIDLNHLPRRTTGPSEPVQIPGEFVPIAPGTFVMGHADKRQVTITRAFEMGKHEVTQAQWRAVMGTEPGEFDGDSLPVERVTWSDAQEYLTKLNARNDGYRYRLPTEAEWEYAARAGSHSEPDADAVAWYFRNSGYETHPVGTKQPNAWGLHDMLGNVEEWVEDWWEELPTGPQTDPKGPAAGKGKMCRGGSFNDGQKVSVSFRTEWHGPDGNVQGTGIGFRSVRERIR
jgi:formylglycine-generating enzyme required for sulfatase activity